MKLKIIVKETFAAAVICLVVAFYGLFVLPLAKVELYVKSKLKKI